MSAGKFVIVDAPHVDVQSRSKYSEVWQALVDHAGRALQFDVVDHHERHNLLTGIHARCVKNQLYRVRCKNLSNTNAPFLLWLESTNGEAK